MPGTPDPVVGSDPVTGIIAASLSVFVIAIFVYIASERDVPAVVLTPIAAMSYGLFAAGLWAGVRVLFHHFALDPLGEPTQFAWLLLVAGGLLAMQAAIPFFLFARFGFVVPVAGFAVISTFLLFTFLRVGGESDPLALFGVGFAPVFIGGVLALALLEAGVRYVLTDRNR
ncbi:hypothetical protein ACLI4Z_18960 [Natrialbaceae archaeon A-arb3/5]